jgi:hypothetical protein
LYQEKSGNPVSNSLFEKKLEDAANEILIAEICCFPDFQAGLTDFLVTTIKNKKNIQKIHKIHKMSEWPKKYLPLLDPPKFTQIGIFGLKIFLLATL